MKKRHRSGQTGGVPPLAPWRQPTRAIVLSEDAELRAEIVAGLRADGFAVMPAAPSAEIFGYIRRLARRAPLFPIPTLLIIDLAAPRPVLDLIDLIVAEARWSPAIIALVPHLGTARSSVPANAIVFHHPVDIDDLRTAALYYGGPMDPDPTWASWVDPDEA